MEDVSSELRIVALTALLLIACLADLRTRRIPNALVLVIVLVGAAATMTAYGAWSGITRSLAGAATGFAIWIPFWLLRMMGGGDVKLFAAGAAWLAPMQAVHAAMFAGIAGGVLSLAYLMFAHGVGYAVLRVANGLSQPSSLRQVAPPVWERRMPYGLAMSAGLLLSVVYPGLFF